MLARAFPFRQPFDQPSVGRSRKATLVGHVARPTGAYKRLEDNGHQHISPLLQYHSDGGDGSVHRPLHRVGGVGAPQLNVLDCSIRSGNYRGAIHGENCIEEMVK